MPAADKETAPAVENAPQPDGERASLSAGAQIAPEGNSTADGESPAQIEVALFLPPGAQVRLTVEMTTGAGEAAEVHRAVFVSPPGQEGGGPIRARLALDQATFPAAFPPEAPGRARRRLRAWAAAWPFSLATTLFGLGVFVYLATRLIGLTQFPIYFFTDEAIQVVLASDFVRDDFHNYTGEFFPAFFENGGKYRLGFSVYLHLVPYLLFGKSVWVTRATAVFFTLAAVFALAYALRDYLKVSYWWSAVLVLSVTPTWFLHSRTAFEYSAAVSLYALAFYFYLRYLFEQPNAIYPALICGALAFYTYSPFQAIVPLTGLMLLLVHWPVHRGRWATLRYAALLAAALALPYVRFLWVHPAANSESLSALGSYWLSGDLSIFQKLGAFASRYGRSLSLAYWFDQTPDELVRHYMKGYSHLALFTFPMLAVGLFVTLRRAFKRDVTARAYQAILIMILAIPGGAALVEVGVTRLLAMVLPAVLLTVIGTAFLLDRLARRGMNPAGAALALFLLLALVNAALLRDALDNGPNWFQEYGMNGMQYGAVQVFGAVEDYLAENPKSRVIFSPTWTNGADVVARFMLGDPLPVEIGSVTGHLYEKKPLDDNTVFVLTPEEYQQAVDSEKFAAADVIQTLPYPNGKPGFYFARLQYAADIDARLAAERAARRELVSATVKIEGETWQVSHSMLDIGSAAEMFDGRKETLSRTLEANPFTLVVKFPEPRPLSGVALVIGSARVEATATLYPAGGAEPVAVTGEITGTVKTPGGQLDFGENYLVDQVILQLQDLDQGEPGQVHVWELTWLP